MPQIKLLTTKNSWMVDSMEHGYECDAPSSLALTRTQQKSISVVMIHDVVLLEFHKE